MADWSQSAAGLGAVFGKFMSGRDKFDDGMLAGAKIRKEQADALATENKNGYIKQAIDQAMTGNFSGANAYSVYGGAGKSGFAPAANGTVLNTITGGLDESGSQAQGFANKLYQEAVAKQAQGMQYQSAANLNAANAGRVQALTPYEQQKLAANAEALQGQAADYYAGAQDNVASANYRDQQRVNTAELLPYEAMIRTAQAQNSFAGAQNNLASAGLHDQQAQRVQDLTPYEAMIRTAQAQNSFAGAQNNLASAGLHDQQRANAQAMLPYEQMAKSAASEKTVQEMMLKAAEIADNDPAIAEKKAEMESNPYGLAWPNRLLGVGRMNERLGIKPNQPAATQSPDQPFPNGAIVRGADGKRYQIVNGQPVLIGG